MGKRGRGGLGKKVIKFLSGKILNPYAIRTHFSGPDQGQNARGLRGVQNKNPLKINWFNNQKRKHHKTMTLLSPNCLGQLNWTFCTTIQSNILFKNILKPPIQWKEVQEVSRKKYKNIKNDWRTEKLMTYGSNFVALAKMCPQPYCVKNHLRNKCY